MMNFKPKHDLPYLGRLQKRQSNQSDRQEDRWASTVPSTVKLESEATGQKHIRNEATGVAVELLLKSILLGKGFLVSDPILSTSYDFITEWDGIINTIQVRSAAAVSKPNRWEEGGELKGSQGGYCRVEVPKVGGFSILLAHIIPLKETFVIPWNELDRRWICVHKTRQSRYEKYKERWNLLKETH